MKTALGKRTFSYIAILITSFVILQLIIYAFIEYRGWKAHPEEPLSEEMEEVVEALALNVILIPVMLVIARWVTRRIMSPISKMSEVASQIATGDFSGRIKTDGMKKDELFSLANVLNAAFDRYDAVVQRLQKFSGDVSHQLRMPITAVRSIGEVVISRERNVAEYQQAIETMLNEMDKLTNIVDQLLQMSRLEAGVLRGQFKPVDMGKAVLTAVQIYSVLCEDKDIKLDVKVEDGLVVKGIESLILEMMGNLIDNASRYTPTSSSIMVGVFKRNTNAVLYVHDNGPGIKTSQAKMIFERFYQSGRENGGRTGLGLSIALDIAVLHGGVLSLVNPDQKGARFECVIPLMKS